MRLYGAEQTEPGMSICSSDWNTSQTVPFGANGDEPVARDYDGDGKTDIAVVRRTGGKMIWYI